jgi:hypothetical protein
MSFSSPICPRVAYVGSPSCATADRKMGFYRWRSLFRARGAAAPESIRYPFSQLLAGPLSPITSRRFHPFSLGSPRQEASSQGHVRFGGFKPRQVSKPRREIIHDLDPTRGLEKIHRQCVHVAPLGGSSAAA